MKKIKTICLSALVLLTFISFQNCGQNFEALNNGSNEVFSGPGTENETNFGNENGTGVEGNDPFPESPNSPPGLVDIEDVNFSAAMFGIESPWDVLSDPMPAMPAPAVGASFENANFKTKVTRLTGPGSLPNPNNRPNNIVHNYSKRQVWNIDETLMLIGSHIVDTTTMQPIGTMVLSAGGWSHQSPDHMLGLRYVGSDLNQFVSVNVRTNEVTVIRTFSDYNFCRDGDGEGNFSNDDRYIVLNCRGPGQPHTAISFDIQENQIIGSIVVDVNFDWIGISQSGKFIIAGNAKNNGTRRLYDKSFNFIRDLPTLQHGDFGINTEGHDVYAMIGWSYLSYVDLETGEIVDIAGSHNLNNPAGHGHLSCRNTRRPGWCYYSSYTFADSVTYGGSGGQVGAVKLEKLENGVPYLNEELNQAYPGTNTVVTMGFHRSPSKEYENTPKASVSPTGRKVIYTSTWYGSHPPSSYQVEFTE